MQTQKLQIAHSITSLLDDTPRLYGIPSEEVETLWRYVKPFILNALEYSDNKFSIDDIFNFLKSRDMQLWVVSKNAAIQGVIVTQIICYPQEKRLCLGFVAGVDFDEWIHFWYPIRDWAKENGCTSCESFSRPGMERKLKSLGFKKIHTILKVSI